MFIFYRSHKVDALERNSNFAVKLLWPVGITANSRRFPVVLSKSAWKWNILIYNQSRKWLSTRKTSIWKVWPSPPDAQVWLRENRTMKCENVKFNEGMARGSKNDWRHFRKLFVRTRLMKRNVQFEEGCANDTTLEQLRNDLYLW